MEWKRNGIWEKILILFGLVITIYIAFRFLLPLFLPFVFAGVVSILYYPFLRKICCKLLEGEPVESGEKVERASGKWIELGVQRKKKYFLIFAVGLLYIVIFVCVCLLFGYLCGQGRSIVLNLPFYQAKCTELLKDCCCQVDDIFHMKEGVSFTYIMGMVGDNWQNCANTFFPKVTGYSFELAGQLFSLLFGVVITVIATFFMIQEYDEIRAGLLGSDIGKKIYNMVHKCKETLKAYVKAQGFIMLVNGVVCTLAFWLVGQPYFLISGPLVALVDALPIFGAGLILIPYTLFLVIKKEFGHALILAIAYVMCILVRQVTEPKMIGGEVGIKPLYMIVGMYLGFKLFGVFGFLLGPVGLLIVKEVYVTVCR